MKKRLLFLITFSLFLFSGFTQSKGLVLKVTLDEKKYSSLDQNNKAFVTSAYMKCLQDFTMVPEISLRTSDIDSELREIQKQSQIDAATGLGSESAAYAADKGSRADLVLNISLSNAGNNNYQFICTVSEIETMNMIISENSDRLPIAELTKDQVVDSLVYDILTALYKRNYISELSSDVRNQLLHLDSSEESFRKYVQDYTRQLEEAEAELAKLQKEAASEQERLELEAQRLALQLKIEMAEKNRQIAEENLRRQQTEDAANEKRQKEMEQMQNAQREQFLKDIEAIEAARAALRQQSLTSLPLKKRIELIEASRANLTRLENQLEDSLNQNASYYDQKMNAEIDEVNSQPWRKADLSNGEPTVRALNYRNQQIQKIRSKYESQKKAEESQLRTTAKPTIDAYQSQLQANLSDMEKTTYVFRSIDVSDDYLSLQVSEFDGARLVWDVYSDFALNNIQKIKNSNIHLPKVSLSYELMTGSKPDLSTDEGYKKYQDNVDMSDLYFRTSVPYLYSQISIKVSYNQVYDLYEVRPVLFQIFRTQNNKKALVSYNEKELTSSFINTYSDTSSTNGGRDTTTTTTTTKTTTSDGLFDYSNSSFFKSQESRRGLFIDIAYLNGSFYQGMDLNFSALFGTKVFFLGFDIDAAYPVIKDEYKTSSTWSDFYLFDVHFVMGLSLKLLFVKPYVSAGIGYYMIGEDKMLDKDLIGLSLEGAAGVDLNLGVYSIGFVYKIKYLYGAGFANTTGISLGLVW
ncbi:MAG: hypothetical protein K6C97_06100 [Treponema sp.]|nr:hypothetical protein [Treponema sp.]